MNTHHPHTVSKSFADTEDYISHGSREEVYYYGRHVGHITPEFFEANKYPRYVKKNGTTVYVCPYIKKSP